MKTRILNSLEKQALAEWERKSREIADATSFIPEEDTNARAKRIANLLGDYNKFIRYYFPHTADCDCAEFHVEAANKILSDPKIIAALEWPREHAKSFHSCLGIPLWLKCKKELKMMLLIGKNETAARKMLGNLQAELMFNKRFIADYGQQYSFGDWATGDFTTIDGCNFVAIGRGQTPRGLNAGFFRPDFMVFDDIDDDQIVQNESRVDEIVKWIWTACYGALNTKRGRMIFANNRIHRKSILAKVVGDTEPGKAKRKGLWHSKIFALDPKTGQPAWKRYTREEWQQKWEPMGYANVQREYFHNPIVEGKTFKKDWIKYCKPLPYGQYDFLILYIDGSFKSKTSNDYKAARLIGKTGTQYHHLRAFVRQATMPELCRWVYDLYETLTYGKILEKNEVPPNKKKGAACEYWIEANAIQSMFLDDFASEGEVRGYQLPIRGDLRKKPEKESRIEAISPLYERGFVFYSEDQINDPDMCTALEQTLAFERGSPAHDDAPDAEEGGIYYLQTRTKSTKHKRKLGERERRAY